MLLGNWTIFLQIYSLSHFIRWPYHAFTVSIKPTVIPSSTFLSANNLASYFTEKTVVIKLELSQTSVLFLLTLASPPLSLFTLESAILWEQHLHLCTGLYPSYTINWNIILSNLKYQFERFIRNRSVILVLFMNQLSNKPCFTNRKTIISWIRITLSLIM